MELLKVKDGNAAVVVRRSEGGSFFLTVEVAHTLVQTYELTLSLSAGELQRFIDGLGEDGPSQHGRASLWSANVITIHPKHTSAQRFREITIRRGFSFGRQWYLGAFRIPTILTSSVVSALEAINT